MQIDMIILSVFMSSALLLGESQAEGRQYTSPFDYGQSANLQKGISITPLSRLRFVNDINSQMQDSATSLITLNDSSYFEYDFSTDYASGVELSNLGVAAADALDNGRFSTDIISQVNGVLVYPGDVVDFFGTIYFDSRLAGFPPGVNLDALSYDPIGGDMVFSIDVTASLGGSVYCADDLILWNGIGYSLYLAGGCVGNVDALALLDNGSVLFSLSRDWLIAGELVRDQAVIELNDLGIFKIFDPFTLWDSQLAADLTALDADRLIDAGYFSFTVTQVAIGEDAGSLSVTLIRLGGLEGEVNVHVQSIDDTATSGVDYTPLATDIIFEDGVSELSTPNITISPDAVVEGSEYFQLNLTIHSENGLVGEPSTLTVEILDAEDYIFRDGFE